MQASNNMGSSAMAAILCPTNGYRGAQSAKGIKPKNHMAAHRQSLKKQEQKVQQRKEEMNNTKGEYFKYLDPLSGPNFSSMHFKSTMGLLFYRSVRDEAIPEC